MSKRKQPLPPIPHEPLDPMAAATGTLAGGARRPRGTPARARHRGVPPRHRAPARLPAAGRRARARGHRPPAAVRLRVCAHRPPWPRNRVPRRASIPESGADPLVTAAAGRVSLSIPRSIWYRRLEVARVCSCARGSASSSHRTARFASSASLRSRTRRTRTSGCRSSACRAAAMAMSDAVLDVLDLRAQPGPLPADRSRHRGLARG